MAKKPNNPAQGTSPESDAALWERVTETAEPLKRGRDRARAQEAADRKPPPRDLKPEEAPAREMPQSARVAKPQTNPAKPPPLGLYDKREARGVGAGRIEIDARIDLHGMRQREAHGALRAFLVRARDKGHRHVLVITGKGSPRSPDTETSFYEAQTSTRGVLRSAVPRWLGEADLRALVVGFTPAAARHGGEGALYVRLRKAGKGAGG